MRRFTIVLSIIMLRISLLFAQGLAILPVDVSALGERAAVYTQYPERLHQAFGTRVSIVLDESPDFSAPGTLEEYLAGFSAPEEDLEPESLPVIREYALLMRFFPPTIMPQTDRIAVEARLELWLLDLEGRRIIRNLALRGLGLAETEEAGMAEAEEELFRQLLVSLRTSPLLGLQGPIARIDGDRILLRIGREQGLRRGDELESPSKALVRIYEVGREYAFASRIHGELSLDDSLDSLDRAGLELQGYARGVLTPDLELKAATGIKLSVSRGVGVLRPYLGLEAPTTPLSDAGGVVLFPYAGAEFSWRRGRWALLPGGAVGVGYRTGTDGAAGISHGGGFGSCEIGFLFRRDWRIALHAGYAYWLGTNLLEEEERYRYNGIIAGLGLVWKL